MTESIRETINKTSSGCIKSCKYLDCKALLFVPGVVKSPISPEIVRYDRALDRLREAINQMLPIAEDLNVDLCMENVWNGFFYSPIELRDFVDSFDSDRLGVYLDIGNLIGYQQYPPHWVELLNSRIKRVQIKDFQENFDWTGSFSFCDIGAGDVPWKETIAGFKCYPIQEHYYC